MTVEPVDIDVLVPTNPAGDMAQVAGQLAAKLGTWCVIATVPYGERSRLYNVGHRLRTGGYQAIRDFNEAGTFEASVTSDEDEDMATLYARYTLKEVPCSNTEITQI